MKYIYSLRRQNDILKPLYRADIVKNRAVFYANAADSLVATRRAVNTIQNGFIVVVTFETRRAVIEGNCVVRRR